MRGCLWVDLANIFVKIEITKNYQVEEFREFQNLAINQWPNLKFPRENEVEPVLPKPIAGSSFRV